MDALFQWAEGTSLAQFIARSAAVTGLLSGVHLVGLTLVVGGALVSSLRLLGIAFAEWPVRDVTGTMDRGLTLGMSLSVATGALLVSPRISSASGNGIFQLKMLLLAAAAGFYFAVYRPVMRGAEAGPVARRATGAAGLVLWLGVALAGCAFILLE
jgi:hypothetical protein